MARDDRRDFLKLATCAIGGGVGLAVAGPVLRLIADPAGKTTVTTPKDPIDLGSPDRFAVGGEPTKVDIIAPVIKDAWTSSRDLLLGAAWVRKLAPDKLVALSAVCPHLGCAIGWDKNNFICPCHDSKFDPDGKVLGGPSKRAMDPLPLEIKNGKILLTWKRYKLDTGGLEEA